jgi:hypothetical protein
MKKIQTSHYRKRFTVIIKDDRSGFQYPASMSKCGNGGMVVEANYAPNPGSTFHIFSDDQELSIGQCGCQAVIQWRQLLCKSDSSWCYRLGIKYI